VPELVVLVASDPKLVQPMAINVAPVVEIAELVHEVEPPQLVITGLPTIAIPAHAGTARIKIKTKIIFRIEIS
jgi:hypothetical protein